MTKARERVALFTGTAAVLKSSRDPRSARDDIVRAKVTSKRIGGRFVELTGGAEEERERGYMKEKPEAQKPSLGHPREVKRLRNC